MVWFIVGLIAFGLGLGLLFHRDINSDVEDYQNDVPPAGMGGAV